MKVLFITSELGYRGTPRFVINCATIAATAGHQVLVWGTETGGATEQKCRDEAINVIIGDDSIHQAVEFSPDIAHIHRSGGPSRKDNALFKTLKERTGCKILETSVFGLVDFSSNKLIDLHAHISKWDLWRWRRWLRPLHQAGILLPNCIDTVAMHPMPSNFRSKYQIPDNAFLIGRLGKTDWQSLGNALNAAMAKNSNIWFATVGDYSADAGQHPIFQKFADRIIAIPRLNGPEELSRFYSACDVTMNFSPIGESFGYVVAESMSCGTPVVTLSKPRNDNAQIELAAPECGGFPVNGAESAADTLEELAADRTKLDIARARCRDSIEQRYSLHVLGPRILKTYELLHSTSINGKALERLFESNGFTTRISESEIVHQLAQVRGGLPSCIERLKMKLAYSLPNAIRIHQLMKS